MPAGEPVWSACACCERQDIARLSVVCCACVAAPHCGSVPVLLRCDCSMLEWLDSPWKGHMHAWEAWPTGVDGMTPHVCIQVCVVCVQWHCWWALGCTSGELGCCCCTLAACSRPCQALCVCVRLACTLGCLAAASEPCVGVRWCRGLAEQALAVVVAHAAATAVCCLTLAHKVCTAQLYRAHHCAQPCD